MKSIMIVAILTAGVVTCRALEVPQIKAAIEKARPLVQKLKNNPAGMTQAERDELLLILARIVLE